MCKKVQLGTLYWLTRSVLSACDCEVYQIVWLLVTVRDATHVPEGWVVCREESVSNLGFSPLFFSGSFVYFRLVVKFHTIFDTPSPLVHYSSLTLVVLPSTPAPQSLQETLFCCMTVKSTLDLLPCTSRYTYRHTSVLSVVSLRVGRWGSGQPGS